jgi:hypothetical protein
MCIHPTSLFVTLFLTAIPNISLWIFLPQFFRVNNAMTVLVMIGPEVTLVIRFGSA